MPKEHAIKLQELIKDARLNFINGMGHNLNTAIFGELVTCIDKHIQAQSNMLEYDNRHLAIGRL